MAKDDGIDWRVKANALAAAFGSSIGRALQLTLTSMAKTNPLAPTQEANNFMVSAALNALTSGYAHTVATYVGTDLIREEETVKQVRLRFKEMRLNAARARLTVVPN